MIDTTPFGNTGIEVSRLGLGGAPLTRLSFESAVATVRRACDLGIRYFDTSPAYGQRLSQAAYGVALEGRDDDLFFATKLGDLRDPHHYRNPETLWAQLGESLRILRRDRVDLLQLHESDWRVWCTQAEPGELLDRGESHDFASSAAIATLERAKREGLCRFTGITGNNAPLVRQVLDGVEVDCCLTAFHFTLVQRGALTWIEPATRERGIAVVVAGILGQLRERRDEWLTDPPAHMSTELHNPLADIYRIQEDAGIPLAELAIRYVAVSPGVTHTLVGADRPEYIEADVEAYQRGQLPDDLRAAFDAIALPVE